MIKYFGDVFLTFLMFGVFAFFHSMLATNKLKSKFIEKSGNLIAFYRLFYVIISLITFWIVYIYAPHSDLNIYDLPHPFDLLILIPQFLSLAGLLWCLKFFSIKEFLGINQIIRWKDRCYNINESDELLTLRIEGPYKYSRHPVYFFSILFLLFRPEMDLFYASLLIAIISYFYIGTFYEERKLVEKFGEIYIDYQKNTPRIFPFKIGIKK